MPCSDNVRLSPFSEADNCSSLCGGANFEVWRFLCRLLLVASLTPNQAASYYRRSRPSGNEENPTVKPLECNVRGYLSRGLLCRVSKPWTTVGSTCNGQTCRQVREELCSQRWRRTEVCLRTKWRTVHDTTYGELSENFSRLLE